MKVQITKEYKYAPDGVTVVVCEPGKHDMPDEYAADAKARGFTKAERVAPKNKALKPDKNKAK
ncbi:MAG: hypothetical protein GY904_18010 [Planctomycetaceae bacterium]|nr:hypothetical protein [Planctomycetaceae bacterium]